jgi:hypothetical protein
MAEDGNAVLRRLREIRSDTADSRTRRIRVARHVDGVRNRVTVAAGMPGMATAPAEGPRVMADQPEAPRRPVAAREARVG